MRLGYKACGIIIVFIIGSILLFVFDPEKYLWMPKCPVYVLTGMKCPACGFQRAMHSMLHLRFAQAVKYNLFLVLAIPYAISLVIVTWLDPKNKLKRLRQLCYSRKTIFFYLFCFVTWWIVRNIIDM